MIIHEPFIATFTGKMTRYLDSHGIKYTFNAPFPQITRHAPYVVEIDDEKKTMKMMSVVMPDPFIR